MTDSNDGDTRTVETHTYTPFNSLNNLIDFIVFFMVE